MGVRGVKPRKENVVKNGIECAWCSHHKQYEPIENFYKDNGHWNGLTGACKDRIKERRMEYYNRNKESISRKLKEKNPRNKERERLEYERIQRELRGE